MKYLAIDYGDARTGICFSDRTGTLASRAETIAERDPRRLASVISDMAKLECVDEIVLGLPKNMNASEGSRAEKTREFAKLIAGKSELNVVFWDERLTSSSAHEILRVSGKKTVKHRKNIDAVAASLILQGYLDYVSSMRAREEGNC